MGLHEFWGKFKLIFDTFGTIVQNIIVYRSVGKVVGNKIGYLFFIRMNSRSLKLGRKRNVSYKTVSRNRRSFKFLTEERLAELRKIKLKKRSENKVKWAVNAYSHRYGCYYQQNSPGKNYCIASHSIKPCPFLQKI